MARALPLRRYTRSTGNVANHRSAWKSLRLGCITTTEEYANTLQATGNRLIGSAREMLTKVVPQRQQIDLVLVKLVLRDLGLKSGDNYHRICALARKVGLQLCPAEVGPALRLAYPDQPVGNDLVVAMGPIANSDNVPMIFSLRRPDAENWSLNSSLGSPGIFWNASFQFVFCVTVS